MAQDHFKTPPDPKGAIKDKQINNKSKSLILTSQDVESRDETTTGYPPLLLTGHSMGSQTGYIQIQIHL